MPALSQSYADMIQNVSFAISDPFYGVSSERDLQIQDIVAKPDITQTIILNQFTGDAIMRKTCSIEYHILGLNGPLADINHVMLTVVKRFIGFRTVTFTVCHHIRGGLTWAKTFLPEKKPTALEQVLQSIRKHLEPTLGVGVVTVQRTWRAGGEEYSLPCYFIRVEFHPRQHVERTLQVEHKV